MLTLALGLLCTLVSSQPLQQATATPTSEKTVEIPDLAERLAELSAEVERQRIEMHIPGLALAIVQDDEVIYARGFGVTDVETGTPVIPETRFAIGSATKAFTSTCIAMLVDDGKLDWDDPITKHLPEFELPIDAEDDDNEVLLTDLLSHQTGFTRMGVLWASGDANREEILAAAVNAEPWSPFRDKFFYNNVMYLAAGEAAAKVNETSFEELISTRLLQPLGMSVTNLTYDAAQKDPLMSKGYKWDEDTESFEFQPMRDLGKIAPAGSINSSVLDMTHWLRFNLGLGEYEGERLVSSRSMKAVRKRRIRVGNGKSYALGWFLERWNRKAVVQHGGNIDGFAAQVALLPKSQIGLVLLTNVTATPLQETIRGIVFEALLGERKQPVAEASEPNPAWQELLGEYVANYAQFEDEVFTVMVQDGVLTLDIPSQLKFKLDEPNEAGLYPFSMLPDEIQVSFGRGENGEVWCIRMHQGETAIEVPRSGFKIKPDGTKADFQPFLGTYQLEDFDGPLTVLYKNGRLACDIPGQMTFDLHMPDDEEWRQFRVADFLAVRFNTNADGVVDSLTFREKDDEAECLRVASEETGPAFTTEDLLQLCKCEQHGATLAKLGTIRMTGQTRLVHSGIAGSVVTTFSGIDRFYERVEFLPFGYINRANDGKIAWSESAFALYDELSGDGLALDRLTHPAIFLGAWNQFFDQIEVLSSSNLNERKHWVVKLKSGELNSWTGHFDAETGDLTRLDGFTDSGFGSMLPATATFGGHRDLHGLRIPTSVTSETEFNGRVELDFPTVEVGVELEPGFYTFKR